MKFEFTRTGKPRTQVWDNSNRKLEQDLRELTNTNPSEKEVHDYLQAMIRELQPVNNEQCKGMLFLMYDAPSSMPADARVDFVYRPTYLAATILTTAMNRYGSLAANEEIRKATRAVLDAAPSRGFFGAGYESEEGFLDTLEIFAQGDTVAFLEKYPEISERFVSEMNKALTYLETDICSGKVKDMWSGEDYSVRGKQVLAMYQKNTSAETEYVWYACYGSNVNRERFMRYINSCSDTTPPVADRPFHFKHDIYFAKTARGWDNGGKAFLDDTCAGFAYGRIYKITREQYEEVKAQEGPEYTKKLELGTVAGIPVYSFTDVRKNSPVRTPSVRYFNTILEGLKECYEGIVEGPELAKYLISRILPENAFCVVRAIKESAHYLTNQEISSRTCLALPEVTAAVAWLVEHKVIQQDRRSIRAGHQVYASEAFFFTTEGLCARELVAAMIEGIRG